jgi:glycerol dehydrogenase
MLNKLNLPSSYIQGEGLMEEIAKHVTTFGTKALYLLAKRDVDSITEKIILSYKKINKEINKEINKQAENLYEDYHFVIFEGECCIEEITRLTEIMDNYNADIIVGIGSGKVHDTAKAVGYYGKVPVVIVPTIAASDAPCSSMSVLYTQEGLFDRYLYLNKNPDLVLVDTDYIVQAPHRLLVAGMGDALSTYYEARACQRSGCILPNGSTSNDIAFHLSKLCLDYLFRYGVQAKNDVQNNKNSEALAKIVEANTLLSGVGFECGGLAAAHAINDGMSKITECNHKLHGEKVAFATITQLILERNYYSNNQTSSNPKVLEEYLAEIRSVMEFCVKVGLPVTLEEMGLYEDNMDSLELIAEYCLMKEEPIHHMEFKVTKEMVVDALMEADKLGQENLFNKETK